VDNLIVALAFELARVLKFAAVLACMLVGAACNVAVGFA